MHIGPSSPVRPTGVRVFVIVSAMLLAACADDSTPQADASPTTGPTVPTTTGDAPTSTEAPPQTSAAPADRPTGPSADLSEELTGGSGVFIGASDDRDPPDGWVQHEFVAAGTAISYVADGGLTEDGRWTLSEDQSAEYRSRIIVRRPADPADASGTVLVEWLNVSGGVDADPEYATLREEIERQGHTWVGVSAQLIGVEGGPVLVAVDVPGSEVAGMGLKALDPDRYASLAHPGDAFAFDIFTQVARALRAGGEPVGGVVPEQLIAIGESQSAFALVTYVNGVQPLTDAFDGFFVHSRGGGSLPIPSVGQSADMAGSISGARTIFRTDGAAPVFDVQTENDVAGILSSASARQPDSDTFRLWEVAGTAHADLRLVGEETAAFTDCGAPINNGPLHVVAKAALRHLVAWIADSTLPPMAPWLDDADAAGAALLRDGDGIAVGGLRTPPVDVPAEVLSGLAGPNPSAICILSGSTLPMTPARLAELYDSRADYETRYAAAVEATIAAGYALPEDRDALEAYARPELVPG